MTTTDTLGASVAMVGNDLDDLIAHLTRDRQEYLASVTFTALFYHRPTIAAMDAYDRALVALSTARDNVRGAFSAVEAVNRAG